MARPKKIGLSYFPLDVDFFDDEKLLFVSARFGLKGEAVAIRLLCRIYRQGYYLEFNDDVALLFARSAGDINASGLVNEVVKELLKRDFFDKDIFERFSILTSRGIQERYLKICQTSKRKGTKIDPQYDCVNITSNRSDSSEKRFSPSKQELTPEETPKIRGESTQSKVKEIKEKNTHNAREEIDNPLVEKTAREVLSYFGFSEMNDFPKLRESIQAMNVLNSNNRVNRFIEQFAAYREYKSLTQERTHGFKAYLGSIEQNFEDGGWNNANWEDKLEKEKLKKDPRGKPVQSVEEVYRRMD